MTRRKTVARWLWLLNPQRSAISTILSSGSCNSEIARVTRFRSTLMRRHSHAPLECVRELEEAYFRDCGKVHQGDRRVQVRADVIEDRGHRLGRPGPGFSGFLYPACRALTG